MAMQIYCTKWQNILTSINALPLLDNVNAEVVNHDASNNATMVNFNKSEEMGILDLCVEDKIYIHVITPLKLFVTQLQASGPPMSLLQQKHLELCTSGLKRYVGKTEKPKTWSLLITKVVFDMILNAIVEPKILRKIFKILTEIEKLWPLYVKECILESIESFYNIKQEADIPMGVWSQLIELSPACRNIIATDFGKLLSTLSASLESVNISFTSWTVSQQEYLQVRVKLTLQMAQHFPDHLKDLIWKPNSARNSSLESVVKCLLLVLIHEHVPMESKHLAGTCIAFLIKNAPSEEKAAQQLVDILKYLGSSHPLVIGNLVIDCPEICHTSKLSFGHLALLNGFLPIATKSLYLQNVKVDEKDLSLAIWLFEYSCDLCGVTQYQYHSFRLLLLWYQKVPVAVHTLNQQILTQNNTIILKSLHLMWTNLDNPIDGVSETVMQIFNLVLAYLKAEHDQSIAKNAVEDDNMEKIIIEIKDKVNQISWQVKGKHELLAELIPYLDVIKFLSCEESLWAQLLDCMSTNYLAPSATQLYRRCVERIKESHSINGIVMWQEHCMPWLIKALSSNNSLLCHNTSHHWLPWTLKTIPESFNVLVQYLENELGKDNFEHREGHLRALIALFKVARINNLTTTLPVLFVKEALMHTADELRLDGFGLICISPRKAESLSVDEMTLLRDFLPHNMNIDSPPFRQQLQSHLRVLMSRARDSCLGNLKLNKLSQITPTIDFVHWLWEVCVKELQPAACFQRTKTCLEWMWVILDSLVYLPERKQRKGGCPDTSWNLVQHAVSMGRWDFFSPMSTSHLLACLLNGTDDVRELASSILTNFFPWPLQIPSQTMQLTGSLCGAKVDELQQPLANLALKNRTLSPNSMLTIGLQLCNSPRAQESDSGALLCRMAFQKFVLGHGQTFIIKCTDKQQLLVTEAKTASSEMAAVAFITSLVKLLECGFHTAKQNILLAAKTQPLHGLTLAMRMCLSSPYFRIKQPALWTETIVRMLKVITDLTQLCREVLGGKVHEGQETAPSFEQMSEAIRQVIVESQLSSASGTVNDDDEAAVLSAEHQLVMTWAWINIKESCVLLGELVSCVPMSSWDDEEDSGGLKPEQVIAMGTVFFSVLTKCRHRGAIEGCNAGFVNFCTRLLAESQAEFYAIPGRILEQVLSQVTETSKAASSVTRRSAGLPLIAQSILASESRAKQDVLLKHCISSLLHVLDQPVPDAIDDKIDLPHVHALNILKAVFREAAVSASAMPYLAKAAVHAIRGFAAPQWAVRNSATQLFSTLVNRMLGQKKTKDDHLNTTTAAEFFSHYPQLQPFVLEQVEEAVSAVSAGSLKLHPSLFPVLSILAKLGTGTATQDGRSLMLSLRPAVAGLARSPLLAVRELAAHALVPLVTIEETPDYVLHLMSSLPDSSETKCGFNWMHGTLVQIHRLLANITTKLTGSRHLDELVSATLCRWWMAGAQNPCRLVRAHFLLILEQLMGMMTDTAPLTHRLVQEMECLAAGTTSQEAVQIGVDKHVEILTKLCMKYADDKMEVLQICLNSSNEKVFLFTIEYLKESLSGEKWMNQTFAKYVGPLLIERSLDPVCSWQPLCSQLAVLDMLLDHGQWGLTQADGERLYERLEQLVQREKNSTPAALALSLSAVCIVNQPEVTWRGWSELLHSCCQPGHGELLRRHAARALCRAADTLRRADDQHVNARLFSTCIILLVDEDSETRKTAAKFVQQLQWEHELKFNVVHPNFALQMLFDYWGSTYGISQPFLLLLLNFFKSETNICALIEHANSKQVDELFEAQDVNPYMEPCVLHKLALSLLKKMVTDKKISFTEILHDNFVEVCTIMETTYQALKAVCSVDDPLNVTCNYQVYRALHGLYCNVVFLKTWLLSHADGSAIGTQLETLLARGNQHLQINLLHPSLTTIIHGS